MKPPPSINVGDRVKIVTPTFFIRCGYPMAVPLETERILNEYRNIIITFMEHFGIPRPTETETRHRGMKEIAEGVAYELCHAKRFGGRERRLYTFDWEPLRGEEFTVEHVRRVKTGTYTPGQMTGGSYYQEPDYSPPFLTNEETHTILEADISPCHCEYDGFPEGLDPLHRLKIEVTHVERTHIGPRPVPGREKRHGQP